MSNAQRSGGPVLHRRARSQLMMLTIQFLLGMGVNLIGLPSENSGLAKAQLTNLSSPNRTHGVKLHVRVAPTKAPSAISDVMHTVLLSSNSILLAPPPTVEIKSLDAQAIEFELSFRVKDFAASSTARHESTT